MRANRYVSYLAAEIEPQAMGTMRQFEKQAQATMDRIANAGGRGSAGLASQALGSGIQRNAQIVNRSGAQMERSLRRVAVAEREVGSAANYMGLGFSRAAQALGVVQGPLGPLAGRLSALGGIIQNLTGFSLGAVLAGGGAFAIGSIAGQYQQVYDRLAPLSESQQQLNSQLTEVIGIAQRSKQALDPIAELYGQISMSAKDAGISQERFSRIVETVAKSTQLGGGTPEGRRAAIQQFSQAFGANFQGAGQEFQSIREQAPGLMRAIAQGLGVEVSQIKELAREGKLSAELVATALERSAASVDASFAKLPPRVGKSLTDLGNNVALFIGRLDQTVGATSGVAQAITVLANNLDTVVVAAGAVAAVFAADAFASFANRITAGGQAILNATANYNRLRNEVAAGNAVLIGSAQAAQQRAQYIEQASRTEFTAAQAAVRSATAYKAQLEAQIPVIQRQIVAQREQLEVARRLDAASRARGGAGRPDLVKGAYDSLNASQRALVLTQQQLVATETELAAAETRLTAATQRYTVAVTQSVAADQAAAASSGRLAAAKNIVAGAMARASAAATGLVNFLGGPWGVAFAAATTAALWLATRTDAAKEAAARFDEQQGALAQRLGITTAELQRQSAAARELALALAQADLVKAQTSAREVKRSLAASVDTAQFRIGMSESNTPTARAALRDLDRIRSGLNRDMKLTENGMLRLLQIQQQFPKAFESSVISSIFGRDPADTVEKLKGYTVAIGDVSDAAKALDEVKKNIAKGPATPLIDVNAPGAPSKATLNAMARAEAAKSDLDKAKAALALAKQRGKLEGETDEAYVSRIAGLIQNVNSLTAAHKAASSAKSSDAKAQAALNKELRAQETARDKADRLTGIMDRYSEDTPIRRLERIRDEAEKAKRAIDDLIGERVAGYDGAFTEDDADRLKEQIDAGVERESRRPYDDMVRAGREELQINQLLLAGRSEEAEFLRRKLELQRVMPELVGAEEATIRKLIADHRIVNDALEERTRVIEQNAAVFDNFRDATRGLISDLLMGDVKGGFKGFFKNIRQAFADAKANEIVMKLIGDPGKRYRDEMTRGLNASASNLSSAAQALKQSAAAISQSAGGVDPLAPLPAGGIVPGIGGGAGMLISSLSGVIGDALPDIFGKAEDAARGLEEAVDAVGDIVVTGRRIQRDETPRPSDPGNVTDVLDKWGADIGSQIAGPGSILSKVLGKLGTALEGVGYGQMGAGLFSQLTGARTNSTGAAIGGALGQVAGQMIGKSVGGALGSALGPIGGMVGGVLGGVVGNLFGGGTPKPSATAVLSGWDSEARVSSREGGNRGAAVTAGDDVQSGLRRILDMFGGTMGAYDVSIGQYKGQWRVSPHGSDGPLNYKGGSARGLMDFNDDYEAAVRAAILDAIQDGAIQGIRESTQRLLRSGKDLDAALDKALKFESVFKRLKKFKDPVGAAIDELNLEFQNLIRIFKEAGASAEEWAQLEELYGLERAEAIKQATEAAATTIQDFIQGITSGPESPLSRRTVYENAAAEVDKFRADIAAGKAVDQDALVEALENFQSASGELYGSREGFFADFADILALARKAAENVGTPTTPGEPGTLPGSPFDDLPAAVGGVGNAVQEGNGILRDIRGLLSGGGGQTGSTGTSYAPSTIGNLPYLQRTLWEQAYGGGGF